MKIEEFRGLCRCAEHRGQKKLNALHIKAENDDEGDILEFLLALLRGTERTGGMEAAARRAKVILKHLESANN